MLITGGAGFIGTNAARHFAKKGWKVSILDNFSRKGTDLNVAGLQEEFGGKFRIVKGDIRYDRDILEREVSDADVVLHLAAQVAVTTSVIDPRTDFETNALGTFNVLEAVRLSRNKPFIVFASTNKVYGALPHLPVSEDGKRYRFLSEAHERHGVSELEPLDFHSPYGVSKGVADQYTIDYSRIYGLKTVSFRQSCVYGTDQFGVEDQGWIAWFTIAAMLGKPLTVYGSGRQVRDALFVEDLVRLYELAIDSQDIVNGKAYNVGGNPERTISLIELLDHLEGELGYSVRPQIGYSEMRHGDQPIFVADTRKALKDLGWKPEVDLTEGIGIMHDWMKENTDKVRKVFDG